jgi:hypothetical protein
MGQWKRFWSLPGFIWRVKAKVDFGGNAAADVSRERPEDIGWMPDGGLAEGLTRRREGAKERKKEVFREFPVSSSAVRSSKHQFFG